MSSTFSVSERKACRSCGGSLESVLDLGDQPIISLSEVKTAPLHLMKCSTCHLVQLKDTVNRDSLFKKYYYRSGISNTMKKHLAEIVEDAKSRVSLAPDDVIVDIGSNDGTLLDNYAPGIIHLGFEPSQIAQTSSWNKSGVTQEFFNAHNYEETLAEFDSRTKKAKIITAIACFYSVEDPNKFLQDVKAVLAPDGLFVLQVNYLPEMLKNNAVGDICHEHLCYYSMRSLSDLLINNGFDIQEVQLSPINGGSFRVFATHKRSSFPVGGIGATVFNTVSNDEEHSLETMKPYQEFANRVRENAQRLRAFVFQEVMGTRDGANFSKEPKTVYALGASTRGSIPMSLAGLLDSKLIQCVVERDESKVGKMYMGQLPIISEEQAKLKPPDYYLVSPYWFLSELLEREKDFLMNGGKFIVPCPEPYVIGYEKL